MTGTETAKLAAMRLIVQLIAAKRLEIEACGLDNVPRRGPVILAARHYHHLFDGVALFLTLPRAIHLLVTLDWATNPFARAAMATLTRIARWPVVSRASALVHERHSTRLRVRSDRRAALRAAVGLLMEQRVLAVFPEGYPNIDPHATPKMAAEEMLPFRGGFAAVAAAAERKLGAHVPIIPVGLHYSRNKRWRVRLRFGTPVYVRDYLPRRRLIAHIEEQVRTLSNVED